MANRASKRQIQFRKTDLKNRSVKANRKRKDSFSTSRYDSIKQQYWVWPGKHNGSLMSDIPLQYLRWAFDNITPGTSSHNAVCKEIERRYNKVG